MSLDDKIKEFKIWIIQIINSHIKNHGHGNLQKDGKITATSQSNPDKVVVTNSTGTAFVSSTIPASLVKSNNSTIEKAISMSTNTTGLLFNQKMYFDGNKVYYHKYESNLSNAELLQNYELATKGDLQFGLTQKPDAINFDTITATITYTDNTPDEEIEFYIVKDTS